MPEDCASPSVDFTLLHFLLLCAQLGQLVPGGLRRSFAVTSAVVRTLAEVVAVNAGEVVGVPTLTALL